VGSAAANNPAFVVRSTGSTRRTPARRPRKDASLTENLRVALHRPVEEMALLHELERFGPRRYVYVDKIRQSGRAVLDDSVRQHMAEMYVGLRAISREDRPSHRLRSTRNIGPIFQSEWKLATMQPPLIGEAPRLPSWAVWRRVVIGCSS
jgi:hypothetical protein